MNFHVNHIIINILKKQIKVLWYVGKTNRNFSTYVQEHGGSDKKPAVNDHLLECKNFNVVNLYSLPPNNNSVEYVKHVDFSGYDNTKIINNFRKP